jgi:hypothetical protein
MLSMERMMMTSGEIKFALACERTRTLEDDFPDCFRSGLTDFFEPEKQNPRIG